MFGYFKMQPFILALSYTVYEVLMSYGSRSGYSNSGGFNRGFSPKPVETGKEYDVQNFTETSRKGDGIAKYKDLLYL